VAELLGLLLRSTASAYQRYNPAMPQPIVDFGKGGCKRRLGSEIRGWPAEPMEDVGR